MAAIAITKDQLRQLQAVRGQIDTDSGRVFIKPVGGMANDGLYLVDLKFADVDSLADPPPAKVSLSAILGQVDESKPAEVFDEPAETDGGEDASN